MKKKEEINRTPLSAYEHDAMWMSYRYAIGRHTAAATMHAGYLVQANYYRLNDKQRELNVYDIRREINTCLDHSFNFRLDLYVPQEFFDPFKAMLEFFKQEDMPGVDMMKYLEDHSVTVRFWEGQERYTFVVEGIKAGSYNFINHLADLVEWGNVANALDMSKHHIAVTDEGDIEVFERIIIGDWKKLEIKYTPIEEYLKNPFVVSYINKENIKELKPLNV